MTAFDKAWGFVKEAPTGEQMGVEWFHWVEPHLADFPDDRDDILERLKRKLGHKMEFRLSEQGEAGMIQARRKVDDAHREKRGGSE